jgi:hypothetical protein
VWFGPPEAWLVLIAVDFVVVVVADSLTVRTGLDALSEHCLSDAVLDGGMLLVLEAGFEAKPSLIA